GVFAMFISCDATRLDRAGRARFVPSSSDPGWCRGCCRVGPPAWPRFPACTLATRTREDSLAGAVQVLASPDHLAVHAQQRSPDGTAALNVARRRYEPARGRRGSAERLGHHARRGLHLDRGRWTRREFDTERKVPLPLTIPAPASAKRGAHDSAMWTANATTWLFPQHRGHLLVRPASKQGLSRGEAADLSGAVPLLPSTIGSEGAVPSGGLQGDQAPHVLHRSPVPRWSGRQRAPPQRRQRITVPAGKTSSTRAIAGSASSVSRTMRIPAFWLRTAARSTSVSWAPGDMCRVSPFIRNRNPRARSWPTSTAAVIRRPPPRRARHRRRKARDPDRKHRRSGHSARGRR